ncbi:MAG: SUMF1/EgtB/PvdO family nonheme iron enzyme [Bacteroidales bacterium]|nr:SUMF1/EgtB/PvdO family nonheme iron enzyme [Bacteroidales bacterium]
MNSLQLKNKKIIGLLLLLLLINLSISMTYSQNPEMVFIEAGNFNMGYNYDTTETWWYPTEIPVHTVYISAFYMDKYEVFKTQWDSVYLWAVDNGYSFDNVGEAQALNHPVYNISWYDVAKWCNARSEKEGLTPVYYTDSTQNTIYQNGQIDLENNYVKWEENGYRLPTEAEWEKAARGELVANHYPWQSYGGTLNDHIDGSKANYDGSGDPYETQTVQTTPVGYYDGNQIPAGIDMVNGYGLYDMAGNVVEWVWDWYNNQWYSNTEASEPDTKGPPETVERWKILRGGSWHTGQLFGLRCALRLPQHTPDYIGPALGFRCAKRDVNSSIKIIQSEYELKNYPNPFNSTTTISFNISCKNIKNAKIEIYNIKGQKVRSLINQNIKSGQNSMVWDGTTDTNEPVDSGIYFYQLNLNRKSKIMKKCLLLK